ncbi:MAG TPA: amidohydrolase family protein [Woeseiaceae bacterium]|nr:amidohydrolase family protein [Woeseiaceae bacterium]
MTAPEDHTGAFLAHMTTLALAGLLAACGEAPPAPADLVFTNAYVYTADGEQSVAAAIAVRDGIIVYVGSGEGADTWTGEATVRRDLGGRMLMPGLHDMHIHALGIVEPEMCDLRSEPYSLAGLVPVLRQCLLDYSIPPGEWLIVLQWSFAGGNAPSEELPHIRAALDAVSTEHPVFLYGDDGHHGAANSLALAMATNAAGENVPITAATLATDYADYRPMVAVDAAGDPTGGVNEDARLLLREAWFEDMLGMRGDLDEMLPGVAARLAASGITTIQDAIVTPATLAAYGRLEERGGMTFRLRAAMFEPPTEDIEAIDEHLGELIALREQYAPYRYMSADGVKLFADAVLEGNPLTSPPTLPVAAVLDGFRQPVFGGSIDDGTFDVVGYVDPERDVCRRVQADPAAWSEPPALDDFVAEHGFYPRQCLPAAGVLEHDEAFIRAYIRKATEAGFHVHVHALADKGVRVAVDELAKVKTIADRNGTSQSLAHVQLAHPDDQARIGELGMSVAFTFVWATPGLPYDLMVIPFIDEVAGVAGLYDPEGYYMQNVYPAQSIQAHGGNPVFGSDAPVGSRDPMPFRSLQQAIYRSDGQTVLNADERLDIHSAIAAFTINGARLFGHADRLGSLEPGKQADFIVLDRNIVELAEAGREDEIGDTTVMLTVFDGRIVHDAAPEQQ